MICRRVFERVFQFLAAKSRSRVRRGGLSNTPPPHHALENPDSEQSGGGPALDARAVPGRGASIRHLVFFAYLSIRSFCTPATPVALKA